jgi:hypothetical protein
MRTIYQIHSTESDSLHIGTHGLHNGVVSPRYTFTEAEVTQCMAPPKNVGPGLHEREVRRRALSCCCPVGNEMEVGRTSSGFSVMGNRRRCGMNT